MSYTKPTRWESDGDKVSVAVACTPVYTPRHPRDLVRCARRTIIVLGCWLAGCALLTACQSRTLIRRQPVRVTNHIVYAYYPWWMAQAVPPATVDWHRVTHVSHAFAWPSPQGALVLPRGFDPATLIHHARAAGVRPLLCIGGNSNSALAFAQIAADTTVRHAFVATTATFALSNAYEGVELDWEFPRNPTDSINFVLLVRDLRQSLATNFLLNIAVNSTAYFGKWIDVERLAPLVDYMIIMTYDYHGSWSTLAGHNAPLYCYPRADGCVTNSIAYWRARGLPAGKLLMGLPFYGRAYNTDAIGTAFTRSTAMEYRAIVPLLTSAYERCWDTRAAVPWLRATATTQVISYDDAGSLAAKLERVRADALAGVAIWQIAGDVVGGRHTLLPVVNDRLDAHGLLR